MTSRNVYNLLLEFVNISMKRFFIVFASKTKLLLHRLVKIGFRRCFYLKVSSIIIGIILSCFSDRRRRTTTHAMTRSVGQPRRRMNRVVRDKPQQTIEHPIKQDHFNIRLKTDITNIGSIQSRQEMLSQKLSRNITTQAPTNIGAHLVGC